MQRGITCRSFLLARIAARWLIAFCVFQISPQTIKAQFLTRPVNLTYLAQRADIIVQGRVSSVRHESLPGFPNIPTIAVTLEVENALRGSLSSAYAFREIFLGLKVREGKQNYQIGQRLFLFLPSPSQYGLSSPIGIEQGRFHINQNSGGSETVMNETGNAGLFENVSRDAAKARVQLSQRQLRMIANKQEPVSLNDFISLIRNLTELPRIR
jgi:hypothetical protein